MNGAEADHGHIWRGYFQENIFLGNNFTTGGDGGDGTGTRRGYPYAYYRRSRGRGQIRTQGKWQSSCPANTRHTCARANEVSTATVCQDR